MKNIIVLAILAFALVSCEKETKLDPNAPVYFNGRESISDAKTQQALSIKEVIKTASHLNFQNLGDWYGGIGGNCIRDTVNNRIIGYNSWVISDDGSLKTKLIEGRNFLILNIDYENRDINTGTYPTDTLGYIPNSVMEQAETDIKAAYNAEDYEECYRLFEEAFVFYPITGAQYLELVDQGLN